MSCVHVQLFDNHAVIQERPGRWVDVTTTLGRMTLAPSIGPSGVMFAEFLWELGSGTYAVNDLTRLIGRAGSARARPETMDRLERFGLARWFSTDVIQLCRWARTQRLDDVLIARLTQNTTITIYSEEES
jgi:hypothetical protein